MKFASVILFFLFLLNLNSHGQVALNSGFYVEKAVKSAFRSDPDVEIISAKTLNKGDSVKFPGQKKPVVLNNDVSMVKLMVGPGHPDLPDAPATSGGIGIEIWLPSAMVWNKRILAQQYGGWSGLISISSASAIGNPGNAIQALLDGYVIAVSDGGHQISPKLAGKGSIMMNSDGSVNTAGWIDLSYRSTHELAVKTKKLVAAYYHQPAEFSYLYGGSSAGRAAYQSAQMYPDDFDGILANCPSIDQTQLFPSLVYGHIVMQRDLEGVLLTREQLDLVSRAAVNACDSFVTGQHDGYISDFTRCNYDPTKDRTVLCVEDGGINTSASALTMKQAQAINKIWYGATPDGSVPSPAVDNGYNPIRPPDQIWWGVSRGTKLYTVANSVNGKPAPYGIVVDQIALNLQDPSMATPYFLNASGNGKDGWKSLTYAQFANVMYQGKIMNEVAFANIDANNPNLKPFRDKGKKMITYHGMADPNVPFPSSVNYYIRSASLVGGITEAQKFHRLFLVPGMGHCAGTGTVGDNNAPWPTRAQMLNILVDWVEKGIAPSSVTCFSKDKKISRPVYMYPKKAKYAGGDVNKAESFTSD